MLIFSLLNVHLHFPWEITNRHLSSSVASLRWGLSQLTFPNSFWKSFKVSKLSFLIWIFCATVEPLMWIHFSSSPSKVWTPYYEAVAVLIQNCRIESWKYFGKELDETFISYFNILAISIQIKSSTIWCF